MVGGGVHGKVVGTAHDIITVAGFIITVSRDSIMMWTRVGEDTTETIIGMDTPGTMNEFLTGTFRGTGEAGIIMDIGKGNEPGAFRTITPGRKDRCRN